MWLTPDRWRRLVLTVLLSISISWQLAGLSSTAAAQSAASIAGLAFWDADRDGLQSPLETVGVPQATVQLLDEAGTVVAETVTTEDGSFRFDGLTPGIYTVSITDLLACYSLNSPPSLDIILTSGQTQDDVRFAFARKDTWCDDPLLITYAAGSCQAPGLDLRLASLDLAGTTGGLMDLGELPGPEVNAFLYWSGAMSWAIGYGDPDVVFDGRPLAADASYGPQVWSAAPPFYNDDYESWTHRATVSAGSGQHSLQGVDGFDVYASGAVLFSVYQDPGLPAQQIMIAEGLDQAEGSAGPNLSPGTTRVVFPLEAAPVERQARLITVVSNVLAGQNSRLWYQTGTGLPPHSIIGSGVALENVLGTPDDMRWDVVETTIAIPAGATWLAVQLESGPAEPLPRLEWVAEALIVPLDCQSPADLASLSGVAFADVNANGLRDAGEVGISLLQIVVRDDRGQVVAVVRSNSDGSFLVSGLAPGAYQVLLDRPPVYVDSTENPRWITLSPGQALEGVDFGLVATTAVTLQRLEAHWQGRQVEVIWQTAQEDAQVTYRVLRSTSPSGPFQVLTEEPIPAQGMAGALYRFVDDQAVVGQTYWYQLQSQPDGSLFGPVAAEGRKNAHRLFLPLATG